MFALHCNSDQPSFESTAKHITLIVAILKNKILQNLIKASSAPSTNRFSRKTEANDTLPNF